MLMCEPFLSLYYYLFYFETSIDWLENQSISCRLYFLFQASDHSVFLLSLQVIKYTAGLIFIVAKYCGVTNDDGYDNGESTSLL